MELDGSCAAGWYGGRSTTRAQRRTTGWPRPLRTAHEVRMSVHFGLLGPLSVSREGRPVTLGSTKQQLILAALLLRPAEAVSTGELTAMLWGDQPPASAAANVRTYVRGLRQALTGEQSAERRISTTP